MRPQLFRLFILFVICLSGSVTVTCTHADAVFVGGAPAQKQYLQALYNTLPVRCRSGIFLRIQLMPGSELADLVRSGLSSQEAQSISANSVDGVYQNEIPTITLRQESNRVQLCRTFAHEIGHLVWQRLLTSQQRCQYCCLYKTQKSAHCLITTYSGSGVEEGFAEAYSYWVTDPATLQTKDPLSSKFIGQIPSN